MIGLVIFLKIIATIITLIEAALLTYLFRWGAFRQGLVIAGLANFIGTILGGLMLFGAASLVFGGAMIGMGFGASSDPRVDQYMWAGVLLFLAILPTIGILRLLLLRMTGLRSGIGMWFDEFHGRQVLCCVSLDPFLLGLPRIGYVHRESPFYLLSYKTNPLLP